jgi:hypothetical protein
VRPVTDSKDSICSRMDTKDLRTVRAAPQSNPRLAPEFLQVKAFSDRRFQKADSAVGASRHASSGQAVGAASRNHMCLLLVSDPVYSCPRIIFCLHGFSESARFGSDVDNWGWNVANALYYGDNLGYLREMDRQSVDLVYLDPPFNSKATYNLLFRSPKGGAVEAQTTAFKDTWTWDLPAETAFDEAMTSGSPAADILRAFRRFLGESDVMAYLAMMTPRLIHLHRVLKDTGSLYLHCDSTASHYLKLIPAYELSSASRA